MFEKCLKAGIGRLPNREAREGKAGEVLFVCP